MVGPPEVRWGNFKVASAWIEAQSWTSIIVDTAHQEHWGYRGLEGRH